MPPPPSPSALSSCRPPLSPPSLCTLLMPPPHTPLCAVLMPRPPSLSSQLMVPPPPCSAHGPPLPPSLQDMLRSLEMPRFTRRYPVVLDTLMRQMLVLVKVRHRTPMSGYQNSAK